jgi:alkanesulfonate monooxygenase SsuD/methylene tetrahydromethanopterin reductase-like flavin-dependent oxidoreductase (luciferase family)
MSMVTETAKEELRMEVETGREILRRLNRIEEELSALRALLEQVGVQGDEEPVMLPMPDGTERPFRPNRPVSRETLEGIRRAAQLARELQKLPEEERRARFFENMERARADAIARGIAIEDEREAAIGD